METILEELNEGVIVVDDQLRVIFANEALTRMGHFEHEEIQGRTPEAIFPPNDIPHIMRQHESGHKYGVNRDEFYFPREDGLKILVIFSERIIQGPDGQEYSLITVTGISEQKRVEEQLREGQREIDADLSTAALIQQSLAPHNLAWKDLAVEADDSPARAQQGITYEYPVAALRRQPENGGKRPSFCFEFGKNILGAGEGRFSDSQLANCAEDGFRFPASSNIFDMDT
jgi:PAS domain S-box-containing protein